MDIAERILFYLPWCFGQVCNHENQDTKNVLNDDSTSGLDSREINMGELEITVGMENDRNVESAEAYTKELENVSEQECFDCCFIVLMFCLFIWLKLLKTTGFVQIISNDKNLKLYNQEELWWLWDRQLQKGESISSWHHCL